MFNKKYIQYKYYFNFGQVDYNCCVQVYIKQVISIKEVVILMECCKWK
jgi:hypothetical protein